MTRRSPHRRTFRTESRTAFIDLFGGLAKGIVPSYFHNRRKIPSFLITGEAQSGKSAAVEAMMRAWSDRHTLDEMKARERRRMFLEKRPCDAIDTVAQSFSVAGRPVRMVFNSSSYSDNKYKFEKSQLLQERVDEGLIFDGAAFFYSDNCMLESNLRSVWIHADIRQYWNDTNDKWHRDVEIDVLRPELRKDPRFQACWRGLPDGIGRAP